VYSALTLLVKTAGTLLLFDVLYSLPHKTYNLAAHLIT
jgi:hypothetical protein